MIQSSKKSAASAPRLPRNMGTTCIASSRTRAAAKVRPGGRVIPFDKATCDGQSCVVREEPPKP